MVSRKTSAPSTEVLVCENENISVHFAFSHKEWFDASAYHELALVILTELVRLCHLSLSPTSHVWMTMRLAMRELVFRARGLSFVESAVL